MLIFNLKKEWYEKIKSGEKRIEYREVKPYWRKRLGFVFDTLEVAKIGIPVAAICYFRCGYNSKSPLLKAEILKIEIVDGKQTDLKIDKPVYAIHFDLWS